MNPENNISVSDSQRLIARHHAARNKRWVKALAFLLLSVGAGAVIGVSCTVLYFKKKMHRVPPRPEAIVDAMVSEMHRVVTLQPEEEDRMREALETRMGEIDNVRSEQFRKVREIFGGLDKDVEAVLGPERYPIWYAEKERKNQERRRERDSWKKHGQEGKKSPDRRPPQ